MSDSVDTGDGFGAGCLRWLATLIVTATALLAVVAPAAAAVPTASGWTQISAADAGFPPGSSVASVIEFDGMLWAAGSVYDRSHVSTAGLPLQATLWSSRDGEHWSPVVNASKAPGATEFGDGSFGMLAATDAELFGFVQFRHSGASDAEDSLEVWSSPDGAHWHVATEAAPGGVRAVLGTDDGLIGVGQVATSPRCRSTGCRHGAIWTSTNGAEWMPAASASEFPAGSYVSAVTPAGSGYLAVGFVADDRAIRPVAWRSSDGTAWQRVQPLVGVSGPAFQRGGVASHDATVLNVGLRRLPEADTSTTSSTTTSTTTTTTTTTAPPSSGGSSRSSVICVTSTNVENAVWSTTTGHHWRRLRAHGIAGNTTVHDVIRSQGHWLIGGTEGDCTTQRTVVYQSKDGRNWQRAATGPALAVASEARFPTALAATTKGAILVVGPLGFADGTSGPDIWIESRR